MTGNFFNEDGQPSELDPFSERQISDRLRDALSDHADRFEPAPNSYLTLSKRLEESAPSPKRSGRGSGRFLAAAAMLVVAAGVGTYFVAEARTGDVSAVGSDGSEDDPLPTTEVPTTTVPTTTSPTTTTTVAPTTTTSPPPEVVAAVVDSAELPRVQTARLAASNLVYTLGLPGNARFRGEGPIVDLVVPEDIDSGQGPLAQITVSGDAEQGFAAVRATSQTMQISEVYVDGREIVVLGQGIAFEAAVQVDLVGTDGTRLATTHTTAGCCDELMPFEARLPVRGIGQAFVVAHGDNVGSGVVPAFSAEPIMFDGPTDSTTYTVFRIRPDDEDQGLNLRDRPDSDEGQILATLPPGATGIRRLPEMPALVGDSYWWQVETADGVRGWAHSWFLTPNPVSLTDEELRKWAETAIVNIEGVEFGGLDQLGLSRRVPVALGWIGDPETVTGPRMLQTDLWSEAGRWPVPEATYGEAEKVISLRSLITPEFDGEVPPLVESGASTRYGFEQDMVESYFAGTRAVTVSGPSDGEVENRSLMLFYEAGPTGPELVGVLASIFIP